MSAPPPPPGLGGMSLYANLLAPKTDGDSSSSISRGPVVFKRAGEGGDSKKPLDASALRFQPIRRPQASKPKPKTPFPKATAAASSASSTPAAPTDSAAPRSTLADWAAPSSDQFYGEPEAKRQRGGRKAKKKNNRKREEYRAETDWDELYDPARPTNVDEYLRSDERIREIREWKDVLYAHRVKRRRGSDSGTASDEEMEGVESRQGLGGIPPPGAFAPPSSYGVPPPSGMGGAGVPPPDDATGDDAYARRLALSAAAPPPPPPPAARSPSPPPLPPSEPDTATISRAPVRYSPPKPQPDTEMDIDSDQDDDKPMGGLGFAAPADAADSDAPARSANRPGQANFATRLMSKYGWASGRGLGAGEDGIIAPLRVQVEKRKKKSDAEGGGWAEPSARAKILGGTRKKLKAGDEEANEDEGKGSMSPVVVLRGMLEGIEDLRGEVEDGLGQEIGEECGEKYGRLERVFVDVERRQVFIKFTDQVSALRAVNALDGRIFNGNAIVPKFFDEEKFEQGLYE